MDKLEEGMYVRTDKGIIEKITEVLEFDGDDYYLNFKNVAVKSDKENDVVESKGRIVKTSYNIKDLIEIGDVIKHPILGVRDITNINLEPKEIGLNGLVLCIGFDDFEEEFKLGRLSIVTKEQFSRMEYKVSE